MPHYKLISVHFYRMIITLPQILFHSGNVALGNGTKIYHNGEQWVARSVSGNDSNLAKMFYNGRQWIIRPEINGILERKNGSIEIHAGQGTHIFA